MIVAKVIICCYNISVSLSNELYCAERSKSYKNLIVVSFNTWHSSAHLASIELLKLWCVLSRDWERMCDLSMVICVPSLKWICYELVKRWCNLFSSYLRCALLESMKVKVYVNIINKCTIGTVNIIYLMLR